MDYVNTVFAFKLFEELWDYFLFITFFQGPMCCKYCGQSSVGISHAYYYI